MMKPLNTKLSYKNSHGFTLLEALLGFLILSIGMLGIASLQAVSMKAGKTSVYGSVAIMKVDELFESMRVNPTVLAKYAEGGSLIGCTGTTECSAEELAQDDVYWWKENLKAGLPDSVDTIVAVTLPTAPSKMATVSITVSWDERDKDAGGSTTKSYITTSTICTGIPC